MALVTILPLKTLAYCSFVLAGERLGDLTFRATMRSLLVKGLCIRPKYVDGDNPDLGHFQPYDRRQAKNGI
ncbi:hypothetical protein [Bradyrhizobium sp. UFLA05-112]